MGSAVVVDARASRAAFGVDATAAGAAFSARKKCEDNDDCCRTLHDFQSFFFGHLLFVCYCEHDENRKACSELPPVFLYGANERHAYPPKNLFGF